MRKIKLLTVLGAILMAATPLVSDSAESHADSADSATTSSLTPDDLQKLIDLTQTVGSFPKCRPSICAFFGIATKPLSLMSEIHCDVPSGDRASFDMFTDAASGYLFSLTVKNKNHLYVIHTDAHLKVLGAIKTGTDDSENVDVEQLADDAPAQLFAVASRALSRCIQDPFGTP